MGRIALAFVAMAACGGGAASPATAPQTQPTAIAPRDAGAEEAGGPTLASYDELTARGATSAPLMHAGRRLAWSGADAGVAVRDELRFDRDTCVTVVFAASSPVRLWLEDDARAKRGEPTAGASGALPPRGPACVKRGESLRVVVEGDADVRAIVFTAP